jgi:hypothetical protein
MVGRGHLNGGWEGAWTQGFVFRTFRVTRKVTRTMPLAYRAAFELYRSTTSSCCPHRLWCGGFLAVFQTWRVGGVDWWRNNQI